MWVCVLAEEEVALFVVVIAEALVEAVAFGVGRVLLWVSSRVTRVVVAAVEVVLLYY